MDFSSINRRPNVANYGRRGNNSNKRARVIQAPTSPTFSNHDDHSTEEQDQVVVEKSTANSRSAREVSSKKMGGIKSIERSKAASDKGKGRQKEMLKGESIQEDQVLQETRVGSGSGSTKRKQKKSETKIDTSSPSQVHSLSTTRRRARRDPTPPQSEESLPSTDILESSPVVSQDAGQIIRGGRIASSGGAARALSGLRAGEEPKLRTSSHTSHTSGSRNGKTNSPDRFKPASRAKTDLLLGKISTSKAADSTSKDSTTTPRAPGTPPPKRARLSTPSSSSTLTSPSKSILRSGGRTEDDRVGSATPTPTRRAKDLTGLFELVSPSDQGESGGRPIRTLRNGRIRARSGSPTPSKGAAQSLPLQRGVAFDLQESQEAEKGRTTAGKISMASRMAGKKRATLELEAAGRRSISPVQEETETANVDIGRSTSEIAENSLSRTSRTYGSGPSSGRDVKATYGSRKLTKTSSFPRSNLGIIHGDGSSSQPLNFDDDDMQEDYTPDMLNSPPRNSRTSEGSAPPTPRSAWRTAGTCQTGAAPNAASSRSLGISAPTVPGVRRTYGMQRSFLAEMEVDEEGEIGMKGVRKGVRNEDMVSFPSNKSIGGKPRITDLEEELETQSNGIDLDRDASTRPSTSTKLGVPTNLPSNRNLLNPSNPLSRRSVGQKTATGERLSYAEMRARYGDDEEVYVGYGAHSLLPRNVKDDAYNANGSQSQSQAMAVSSITSLRSAGELRRFNDELEYLLGGLGEDHSLSIKRSSAVELIRKICGEEAKGSEDGSPNGEDEETLSCGLEFLKKLKASESISKVFDLLVSAGLGTSYSPSHPSSNHNITRELGEDSILSVALAMFFTSLFRHQGLGESLLRERGEQVFNCLYWLLSAVESGGRSGDGIRMLNDGKKGKSLPKSERLSLEILRTLALASIFPPNYAHPSQRSLLLRAICSLSSYPPRGSLHPLERISSFQQDTNDSEEPRKSILSLMVTLFCREADKAGERLDAYTKGLDLIPSASPSDGPDVPFLDLCTRLFEICTTPISDSELAYPLSSASDNEDELQFTSNSRLAKSLVTSLQVCHLLSKEHASKLLHSREENDQDEEDKHGNERSSENSTEALLGLLKVLVNLTQTQTEEDFGASFLETEGSLAALLNLILSSARELSRAAQDEESKNGKDSSPPVAPKLKSQRGSVPTSNSTSRAPIWLDDGDESELSSLPPTSSPSNRDRRGQAEQEDESPTSTPDNSINRKSNLLCLLLDVLCLSLGVLTNLLESNPSTTSELLAGISLDSNCKRRPCAKGCECLATPMKPSKSYSRSKGKGKASAVESLGSKPVLEHLTLIFLSQKSKAKSFSSEDEGELSEVTAEMESKAKKGSDAAFLSGCLAVSLALAIFGDKKSREIVGDTLAASSHEGDFNSINSPSTPTKNSSSNPQVGNPPSVFVPLSETLDEFAALNETAWKQVSKQPSGAEGDVAGEGSNQKVEEEAMGGDGLVSEMARKMRILCGKETERQGENAELISSSP